ncbi:MAG TPA: alpha/beta hydrolase [Rhizomicrobium sp.]|nr:alpha/beta hydrolase [Rhizomicrobium sp.]
MLDKDVKFSRIATNGIHLGVAEAGPPDGPLVILLHGFPEFWFCWRSQIGPLAAKGFHVVAPDQRGYNLSDKPRGVAAYDLDQLAKDIAGLADHFGARKFLLAGHDWGGNVGWWLAQNYPGRVEKFVSISAGHPAVWRERMESDPVQRQKSTNVRLFRIPWFPEYIVRRRNFEAVAGAITATARPGTVSDVELARYREAWSQKGAITGGLNWYRAILKRRFPNRKQIRITVPTLVIWGDKDVYGDEKLVEESVALCSNGELVRLENATHWALQDEPDRVNALLGNFFADA